MSTIVRLFEYIDVNPKGRLTKRCTCNYGYI